MNRHSLKYLDLHPQPLKAEEPPTLAIVAGACLALVALWAACAFVFSF